MFEEYNGLFNRYLRICRDKYDIQNPYQNLEDCCITCEHCKWELIGMLSLMEKTGIITSEKSKEEFNRILESFSTHDLYNAHIDKGEIMVWEG